MPYMQTSDTASELRWTFFGQFHLPRKVASVRERALFVNNPGIQHQLDSTCTDQSTLTFGCCQYLARLSADLT